MRKTTKTKKMTRKADDKDKDKDKDDEDKDKEKEKEKAYGKKADEKEHNDAVTIDEENTLDELQQVNGYQNFYIMKK